MNGVGYGITPFMGTHGILARSAGGGGAPFVNEYSMTFDGSFDYVDVGNPASLQITGAITLSAWIKTTDTSAYEFIIGKDNVANGTRSYSLMRNGSIARFNIYQSNVAVFIEGTTTINDGFWHHILGVNDGTDLKIYVDGVLDGTNVGGGGTMDNGTFDFEIGRRGGTSAQRGYWTGNIDSVAVWDNDQSANINSIYSASGVPDISSLNPLSWWRMGDGDSFVSPNWTFFDNGSGGNDATSTTLPEEARVPDVPPSPFVNKYSIEFDGNLDYVTMGNPASLQITGALTLSAWVKIASSGGQSQQCIISKHNGSTQRSFVLWAYTSGSTTPIAYIYSGASVYSVQATTNIRDGFWHHVMLVYTPSTSLNIYIDGVVEGSNTTSIPASINNATQNFEIGRFGSGVFQVLGNIDSVAVWDSDESSNINSIYSASGVPDISSLNPLSWWRMGDGDSFSTNWTFFDNGSGGNDATSTTLPESARLPITANSYSQNSFVFDGSTDFVTLGNDASLQISGNFSISVWIKYSSIIQAYAFSGCGNKYGIYVQNNLINLQHRDTGNVFRNVTSTSTFNDNQWHHVLGVNDGTNLKLYIDGTLNNSNSLGGANITSTLDARIGSISTASGWEFSGKIDEVYIWDNDQSGNISTIYGNGVPTDISSLNPLGHWRFGETDTFVSPNWTIVDQGSGGNDGTSSTLPEGAKTGDQPYVL